MKIAIGNDHAGPDLKFQVMEHLKEKGIEVINIGCDNSDRVDYPDFGEKIGRMVAGGEADLGIAICGTGIGITIAANKVKGIRAAVCSDPLSAKLAKEHNNANVLGFGARIVGPAMALEIVDAWLNAEFQGGRHADRVAKLMAIESK